MKTDKLFILIATAAFSYLFYMQSQGVNYLLFNLLMVVLFLLKDKTLLSVPSWLVVAAGSLLSSFFVFWWGTTLPLIANYCSLLALAGLSFKPESSLLVASFNTFISICTSLPRVFHTTIEAKPETNSESIFKKVLLVLVPLLVTFVFILVYRASNPIFAKLTDKISFDFISFNWCVFTFSGFFIMYGFFRIFAIPKLNDSDSQAGDDLPFLTLEQHLQTSMGKGLTVSNELFTGVTLFILLNAVLLCVNGIDVFYMWIADHLHDGITIAEYLHDGTETLIFSIVMAIAVILFVFRGYLNFFENNKWLKLLAYTWIAQNALLVITTANRNWWIIEQTGLTRRRIGVYVYLFLCLIGLATTFLKVIQKKSNWFLFRKNAWAFYAVFIASCFINWDDVIVSYNCKHYKTLDLAYIDRNYQAELSHTCLATLFRYYADEKKEANVNKQVFTNMVVSSMYASYDDLKTHDKKEGWQSFCMSRHQNLDAINEIVKKGEVPANVSPTQ